MLATWWLKKMKRESEEKQAEAWREGWEEGFQEGLEEVRQERIREGRRAERQRWEAWARQVVADARAAGISITEPPPFDEE